MQQLADRLLLSPSDVTAYLACEHLTTLSLRAARKEIVTPTIEDEQRELVFRKGLEHERAYLERLRAPWASRRDGACARPARSGRDHEPAQDAQLGGEARNTGDDALRIRAEIAGQHRDDSRTRLVLDPVDAEQRGNPLVQRGAGDVAPGAAGPHGFE